MHPRSTKIHSTSIPRVTMLGAVRIVAACLVLCCCRALCFVPLTIARHRTSGLPRALSIGPSVNDSGAGSTERTRENALAGLMDLKNHVGQRSKTALQGLEQATDGLGSKANNAFVEFERKRDEALNLKNHKELANELHDTVQEAELNAKNAIRRWQGKPEIVTEEMQEELEEQHIEVAGVGGRLQLFFKNTKGRLSNLRKTIGRKLRHTAQNFRSIFKR